MRLLIALLLVGCGNQDEYRLRSNITIVHDDFIPLLDQFAEDCPNAPIHKLGSLVWSKDVRNEQKPDRLGVCYFQGAHVQIAEQLLNEYFPPILLKMTVYHELGHCLLNLDHGTGLMAPFLQTHLPEYYELHEKQLIRGMCGT